MNSYKSLFLKKVNSDNPNGYKTKNEEVNIHLNYNDDEEKDELNFKHENDL